MRTEAILLLGSVFNAGFAVFLGGAALHAYPLL